MQDPIARLEAGGFTVKTISALPYEVRAAMVEDNATTPRTLGAMACKQASAMIEAIAALRANGFGAFADYVLKVPVVFTSEHLWNGAPNDNSVMATIGGEGRTYAFTLNVNATIAFDGPRTGNPWAMAEGRAMGGGADAEAFTLKGAALHEMGHALDFRVHDEASESLARIVGKNVSGHASIQWVADHVSDYGAQSGSEQEAEAEQFAKLAMGRTLTAPFAAWGAAVTDIARTGDFKAGRAKLAAI